MESQNPQNSEAALGDDGDAQHRLGELESKLKEKETLVAALTGRLEQAAEQLDRLRRMGADRGARTVAGVPPELIEEQRELTAQLQIAVNEWQEANAAAALSRIEVQVAEIKEMVCGLSGGIPHAAGGAGLSGALFERARQTDSRPTGAEHGDSSDDAQEGTGLQGWEALKASMLSGTGDEGEHEHAPAGEAPRRPPEHIAAISTEQEPPELIPDEDPPESIDIDAADIDALRAAVEARDAYISHLLKKLKQAFSYQTPPVDWRALENVPEELQTRLADLEQQLQQKLRISEVEISIERARMGREAARITQLSAQVQKKLERVGDASGHDDDEGPEEKKGRRWLSMLGLNHEDDD